VCPGVWIALIKYINNSNTCNINNNNISNNKNNNDSNQDLYFVRPLICQVNLPWGPQTNQNDLHVHTN